MTGFLNFGVAKVNLWPFLFVRIFMKKPDGDKNINAKNTNLKPKYSNNAE